MLHRPRRRRNAHTFSHNVGTPVFAGYGWQIGWFFEVAWQIAFTIDAPASPWICMFLLIGAFLGFAITLLSLFRSHSLAK